MNAGLCGGVILESAAQPEDIGSRADAAPPTEEAETDGEVEMSGAFGVCAGPYVFYMDGDVLLWQG